MKIIPFEWFQRVAAALSPKKVTGQTPIARSKALYEQFQRIGGGLNPTGVSDILRAADAGQPARFVDLTNEARQKDGHMHGVLGTRDRAVSLVDLEFITPEDANRKERKAAELCRRIRDNFKNWPTLIVHLTRAYLHGHATCEIRWETTPDGFVLPVEARPIHQRDFIFALKDGSLRYARFDGDVEGVDLLAQNPGRIVQLQRQIVGDVQVREGLARILVWAALFRNWTLRDWLALGEIGWKPWRIGVYKAGTHRDHIEDLIETLERLGSEGVGAIPDTMKLEVKWPEGSGTAGVHSEFFDTLGREMSKAVLGQTTTTEAGPNGDRASTETRDKIRGDIHEEDCRAVAAVLYAQLFTHAVALNIGANVRVPACVFQTDEGIDLVRFSSAIKTLRDAGLRMSATWVRDQAGMPHPTEDEETLGPAQPEPEPEPAPAPEPDPENPEDEPGEELDEAA